MLTKDQVRDQKKFFIEKGAPGFSPKRNKLVIDEVIKETDQMMRRRDNIFTDRLRERTDAVATYLKAVQRGKEPNVDKYFGKRMLAHLRGQKIVEIVKGKTKQLLEVNN